MFADNILNTSSASSVANPASSSDTAAESALFQTLFAMPATMNTINQDFCLFDADESSFDYPLFNGAAAATAKNTKVAQPICNPLSFFNNPLCTPQTPSIDIAIGSTASQSFGFDSCTAFLDDSALTQQALIDTPFTPYLDTPALLNTPMDTPYLADFGLEGNDVKVEDAAPLFPDFNFDFAFDNVYTIEPSMLLPVNQQQGFQVDNGVTLPSPSLSLSTLSSAPSSPMKDMMADFEEDSDDEFVSSRSAALVSGLKRKVSSADSDVVAVKKMRPVMGSESAAHKKSPATKRFSCSHPGCDRGFARLFNLHTHEKTHDPEQARPFLCPEAGCDKAFSRKHDLQRHEASVHKGERNFACASCHKPFSRQDGLRRHLAVKGACSDNHWLTT